MAVNQIKAGVVLNYIVIGLNALVGLVYTPYMLRMMGQSEYGLSDHRSGKGFPGKENNKRPSW